MKRYLFIGGPWDGQHMGVPPDAFERFETGEAVPRATYEVQTTTPQPVPNGPDWHKYMGSSSVTITRHLYRREVMRGNTGQFFCVFVCGDGDIIWSLITHYRPNKSGD